MLHGPKKRITTAIGALVVSAGVGFLPSIPAHAQPSIDDVQAKVDRLYREAEQASERYNDARLQLKQLQGDLDSLRSDQKRQDARLELVREQVRDSIVQQYEGEGISAIGQVIVSNDPQAFLGQLATMSTYTSVRDQNFSNFSQALSALQIRSDATHKRADQIASLEKDLAAQKAGIDDKLAQAKALLSELEAKQREALVSRGSFRVPTDVPASGRAAAAVAFAMAQVGKAYVYGAAGPSAFDCSGLTMAAWAQAGVALPHSSSAQYGSGPHVAASDLRPGDLVFYYSPISHVGMYIGNGMIVNAENPSSGIRVTGLYSMPYVGAVRPG